MISRTTNRFWELYRSLPAQIQRQAKSAYQRFQQDPHHPGLRFKQVHVSKPIYSVRIGRGFRALGVKHDDEIVWFWIGSHADYDNILSRL